MLTRSLVILFILFSFFPQSPSGFAQEGALTGAEIMNKSRELLYQVDDQKNTVTLWLIEPDGAMKRIVASRYWKNYRGEGGIDNKMLLVTEFPADSRGVAFLVWDYAQEGKPDDLWLHLPALRMVRRISGQDLNDAFLGSDLTFGDMGQRALSQDTHTLLNEELYQGDLCYVVESVPKEKESPYHKKVSWISKKNWTILKIDYYDPDQKLLKRQTIEWQQVKQMSVWKRTNVTNIQNAHRTVFEVSGLEINTHLQDQDFTERALKQGLR